MGLRASRQSQGVGVAVEESFKSKSKRALPTERAELILQEH